ncbi:MAG: hypothetical protein WAN30_02810 [Acidimicrobiales bacterium]
MSRLLTRTLRSWRVGAVVGVSALTLASCVSQSSFRVTGLPSLGISVPLHTSACTLSGSCIALGTTGSDTPPTSVGEYRQSNGTWSTLAVPEAPSALISSVSCLATQCLIGGFQSTGNLLWNYNASSQSVVALGSIPRGRGVRALSCFGVSSCAAVITNGVNTDSKITFSNDDGATWSTALPLAWSSSDSVTDLACTDSKTCLVSATSSANTLVLEVTVDGGLTWRQRTTNSTWTDLTSLHCAKRHCVALVNTPKASYFVTSSTLGRRWHASRLGATANSMACTSLSTCVVVGETKGANPWFATDESGEINVAELKYVPSPLVSVACAAKVCTAIGVSTVLSYRP